MYMRCMVIRNCCELHLVTHISGPVELHRVKINDVHRKCFLTWRIGKYLYSKNRASLIAGKAVNSNPNWMREKQPSAWLLRFRKDCVFLGYINSGKTENMQFFTQKCGWLSFRWIIYIFWHLLPFSRKRKRDFIFPRIITWEICAIIHLALTFSHLRKYLLVSF